MLGGIMSGHRLFVALRPPRPVRTALIAAMHGIAAARWQSDEQLHLTLRFIGEVDRHRAEDVAAALGALHAPAVEARIAGVGVFERQGRSEEHTSELQSLMRISYAVFCLQKQNNNEGVLTLHTI